MELEEAIEQLKDLKEDRDMFVEDFADVEDVFVKDKEAIDRVLQELDRLQKENDLAKKALIANSYEADERNNLLAEVQRLKKENEKLKTERDSYRAQVNSAFDNGFIHKDKIIEEIEELNKLLPNIDYRDIEDKQEREYYKKEYHKVVAQINVLENLLKEE